MAGSTEEAGERVPCPSCGTVVLQKTMIPVLADPATASHRYLCVTCARAEVVVPSAPDASVPDASASVPAGPASVPAGPASTGA
jgi:DNA-directed RNA polymerase subunit RPC12/RpoP